MSSNSNDPNLHPADGESSFSMFPSPSTLRSQPPNNQLEASLGSSSSSTSSVPASPTLSNALHSSTQSRVSSAIDLPVGLINFVGQSRPDKPAKFCVVDKSYSITEFAKTMLKAFSLSKPDVLISITGSAIDFDMRSSKLEQVFDRGLLKAAQNTNAWIITGGSDAGVMKRVGHAIRGQDQVTLVPCIGIASYKKVTNHVLLDPLNPDKVQYVFDKTNGDDSAALNPDHTHFILVDSSNNKWGEEITFRTELEDYINKTSHIPLVLVAVNGGPGTIETILQGITRGFPIIIVDGSGRASDAIAAFVKNCRDPKRYSIETWNQFKKEIWKNMTEKQENTLNEQLDAIRKNNDSIIIFNPHESEIEDMDKVILRSIFTNRDCSFKHKLKLGVKWGRADVLEELFQQYDASVRADIKAEALAIALNESLRLDKPDIYELMVRKGAGLDKVNIPRLYYETRKQIRRLFTFAGCKLAEIQPENATGKAGKAGRMKPKDKGKLEGWKGEPKSQMKQVDSDLDLASATSSLRGSRGFEPSGMNSLTSSHRSGIGGKQNSLQKFPSRGQMIPLSQSAIISGTRESSGARQSKKSASISDLRSQANEASEEILSQGNESTPLLYEAVIQYAQREQQAKQSFGMNYPREILRAIDPRYVSLLDDDQVTYTDILVWAILADRFELAKAVWRRTRYSVHSALVACRLYKVLEGWFRDEVYKQQYTWFETSAVEVLSEMKHEDAVKVLEWQWPELSSNALELAESAECKDFFSAMHVQRNFDDRFHSRMDKSVQVAPGTKILKIFLMMLTFTWYNSEAYISINSAARPKKISYFYSIPVVKLLSSTISYIIFLGILVGNIVTIDPRDSHASRFDIMWYEWLLWIWLFSELLEEVNQFLNDPKNHFTRISNRMDAFMYGLLLIYLVLRLLAWQLKQQSLLIGYTDILVLATIACFLRFMNVFAFSKSLGPLFFVIIRLFTDVWHWLFIFMLFMISFQVGIFAFTLQAGESGWAFFPDGSMGVSFTAILGDLGERTMELMSKTRFGVAVVLLYSLVTQVMLVNLLIAMMGNTYTTVKDNSDKEWKFYRYRLLNDYHSSSSVPPPLNVLNMIYRKLKKNTAKAKEKAKSKAELLLKANEEAKAKTNLHAGEALIMKQATEKVIENHEARVKYALPSVSGAIYERTRLLTTQRDSDREYLENKIQGLEERLEKLEGRLDKVDGNIQTILTILQPNVNLHKL